MLTSTSSRDDRSFSRRGSVDTARSRARRLALVAIVIYAGFLFGLVMLAHDLLDRERPLTASETISESASAPRDRSPGF